MPRAMPRPLILVVDDEALLRMLASEVFQDAGYEVIEASTGAEAMSAIAARPDVRAVFTDINMPGSPDGLHLAQHVREVMPGCAIVIASGRLHPPAEDVADGALFVPKPYSSDAVVAAFQELLGLTVGDVPDQGSTCPMPLQVNGLQER